MRHKVLMGMLWAAFLCLWPSAVPQSWAETIIPTPAIKPRAPLHLQQPTELKGAGLERLSKDDIEVYKNIYSLQEMGRMSEANTYYNKLSNTRLLGHMLYQRYMHPTAYRSKFSELKSWMDIYADHPNAQRIYNLAQRKMPKDFNGSLTRPVKHRKIARVSEPTMLNARIYQASRPAAAQAEATGLKKAVRRQIKTSQITLAVKKIKALERSNDLDDVEIDELRGRLSSSYLYGGYLPEAKKTAQAAVKRSGAHIPEAAWVAGLIAWKEGKFEVADDYFEIAASSPYASGWDRSAAAYWAARTHMKLGNSSEISIWLDQAAEHPRTFYGLLATRALGQNFEFNWDMPRFTKDTYKSLAEIAAGSRAMALVAIGQEALAEEELMRLNPKDPDLRHAMMAYADYADLPALAMRLGGVLSKDKKDSQYFDGALYPVGHWKPLGGYKISDDLVHAIIRQESLFDTMAQSKSGARGLMQIMPNTARYISKKSGIRIANNKSLNEPETNLALGQFYIDTLLGRKGISGDMTSLLIAYNAGPGNLNRWKKRWPSVNDPLLFIELLPSSETRQYVEKVLANFWIYRMRSGEPTPTLSALSSGKNPLYAMLNEKPKIRVASNRISPALIKPAYRSSYTYND